MGKDIHGTPYWLSSTSEFDASSSIVRSAAPLPSISSDWPEEARTNSSVATGSVVTERVPGGYVARSMPATEVESRRQGRQRIRDLLIGCTASQLHDIENAINRIIDPSPDTRGDIDG